MSMEDQVCKAGEARTAKDKELRKKCQRDGYSKGANVRNTTDDTMWGKGGGIIMAKVDKS